MRIVALACAAAAGAVHATIDGHWHDTGALVVWPVFPLQVCGFAGSLPDLAAAACPLTRPNPRAGFAPWSLGQRAAAPIKNGAKLLGVGFCASMLGVGITNALIALRRLFEPDFAPPNAPQNPLVVSGAYASYMATSSNLRYQLVAGVFEERGIEVRAPRAGMCWRARGGRCCCRCSALRLSSRGGFVRGCADASASASTGTHRALV